MADDNCENCGSSRLKEFKYREGYGCWDCGYTSDEDASRMACSDCDSLVEDGSCLCGKTRTETSEKSLEPAAWRYIHAFTEGVNVRRAELGKPPESSMKDETLEPLVRLSDVIAIIEGHRDRYEERRKEAFDSYMEAESEKNQRVHQSVAAQNQDRVETLEKILEEFTQLSEAE